DSHLESVIRICRMVEGMPLGSEMATTWLRIAPCSRIAAQLEHDIKALETDLRNVPERHRSLRAVFEHSWVLLSPEEQNALMKLAVFRGGFSQEAAEQIAAA